MDSKNQKIKRPKRQQKVVVEDYWDCSVCTFRNTAEAFKCLMCDVRKGKFIFTQIPLLNNATVFCISQMTPHEPQKLRFRLRIFPGIPIKLTAKYFHSNCRQQKELSVCVGAKLKSIDPWFMSNNNKIPQQILNKA